MRMLRPALPWMVLTAAVLAAVVVFGLAIVADPAWSAAEMQVVIAVNAAHAGLLDVVALGVNLVFGPAFAFIVAIVVLAVVGAITRSWRTAVRMGLVIAIPWALADLVKVIVRRARPDAALLTHATGVEPTTFSYPSGHTAFAAALMTALVLFAARRTRVWVLVAAVVVVAVTAWSRVYLGAHYPSDVIASIVLVPIAGVAVYRVTALLPLWRRPPSSTRPASASSRSVALEASVDDARRGGDR